MWETPRTGCVSRPDAPPPSAADTQRMLSSQTTYHSRAGSVQVLPGASHSDAWAYITKNGPLPKPQPSSHDSAAGHVRRHGSSREPGHRRGALTDVV